jgi:hypothetical protein
LRTLGLFRHWIRQASRAERATTSVVAAVVVLLVAAALVPAPAPRARASLRAGTAPPNERGAPALTPSTVAGESPATSVVSSGSGVSGTGNAGREGGAPSPSDRATNAGPIKLGFTVIDDTRAEALGYQPGLRSDASQAIDAFVDFANDQGGVLGRRIEAVKVHPDFVNADNQRQKCIELTEGEGVFAVIDSIALGGAAICVTAEHGTLLINGAPTSAANFARASPHHVSLHKDDNRAMKDLANTAKATGFFDRANGFRQLGVLNLACDRSIYDGPNGLFAHLRAVGVTDWVKFTMPCDPTARAAARQAVLAFEDAEVTHVLLAVGPPFMKEYLDAAGDARYKAKHFTSDYATVIMGGLVDQYDQDAFDGALGVTQTHVGEGPVGKPLSPLAAKCSKILTDHGLAPVSAAPPEDINDDFEVLELCENFMLFLDVAARAGTNLTRASWLDALARTGEFRGATVDLARFAPGKNSGGDTLKLVQWHASCRCWRDAGEFGPAAD